MSRDAATSSQLISLIAGEPLHVGGAYRKASHRTRQLQGTFSVTIYSLKPFPGGTYTGRLYGRTYDAVVDYVNYCLVAIQSQQVSHMLGMSNTHPPPPP
jgi:hypothetical protein